MIPISNALACIVTLCISLILPLGFWIVYGIKNKGQGIWSAWLLGAAGFVITQVLIRLPILTALSRTDGFLTFSQSHPVLYGFSLAFTAGLFELAGRYAVAKILQKKLTYRRALAAGLGHGGIEAILITGIAYVSNLVFLVMIQTGGFDATLAQTTAAGGDVSQLLAARDALANTSWVLFLLAGFERLLAMTCHAAMSMIVCYAVHTGRTLPGVLLCLGLHTCVDSVACISLFIGKGLTQAAAYTIIYILLIAITVLSILILRNIRHRWAAESAQEVSYDSQA